MFLVCGHMHICLEKLFSQHSLHIGICVMFVFTKKEKIGKLFQNLIWLLWKQTNKKCFSSYGLGLIALPFKTLFLGLMYFFPLSIFKEDLMAYVKTCLIYFFLMKKGFLPYLFLPYSLKSYFSLSVLGN